MSRTQLLENVIKLPSRWENLRHSNARTELTYWSAKPNFRGLRLELTWRRRDQRYSPRSHIYTKLFLCVPLVVTPIPKVGKKNGAAPESYSTHAPQSIYAALDSFSPGLIAGDSLLHPSELNSLLNTMSSSSQITSQART